MTACNTKRSHLSLNARVTLRQKQERKKKERFVLQKKKNTCTQRLGSEGAFVPGPHARRRFSSGDSAQSSQIDRSIFITALDTKTDVFLSPLKGPCKMIPSPFPANCTPDLEEERSFVHFLPLFFFVSSYRANVKLSVDAN